MIVVCVTEDCGNAGHRIEIPAVEPGGVVFCGVCNAVLHEEAREERTP